MNVVVGEGLGPPAVANILDLSLRDVEGAVPYDHEIAQNPSTVTDLQAFKSVGDGAHDVPWMNDLNPISREEQAPPLRFWGVVQPTYKSKFESRLNICKKV